MLQIEVDSDSPIKYVKKYPPKLCGKSTWKVYMENTIKKNYGAYENKFAVFKVQELKAPQLFTYQPVKTNTLVINESYIFSLIDTSYS